MLCYVMFWYLTISIACKLAPECFEYVESSVGLLHLQTPIRPWISQNLSSSADFARYTLLNLSTRLTSQTF